MLNYIGPNIGEGIRVYINGTEEDSDTTKSSESRSPGDGRVVLGRYIDSNVYYASVDVDELLFFNEALSDENIQT